MYIHVAIRTHLQTDVSINMKEDHEMTLEYCHWLCFFGGHPVWQFYVQEQDTYKKFSIITYRTDEYYYFYLHRLLAYKSNMLFLKH